MPWRSKRHEIYSRKKLSTENAENGFSLTLNVKISWKCMHLRMRFAPLKSIRYVTVLLFSYYTSEIEVDFFC